MEVRNLFEQLNMGFARIKMTYDQNNKPTNYQFLEINKQFSDFFEISENQFLHQELPFSSNEKDNPIHSIHTYIEKTLQKKEQKEFLEYSTKLKKYALINIVIDDNQTIVILIKNQVTNFSTTNTNQNESIQRIELLNTLLQNPKDNIEAVLDQYMNAAIELTKSKIGYLYLYNEETELFTLNNWSNGVMDVCAVTEPKTVYELDKTGLWGEVVRQRRHIIVNDYEGHNTWKKGTPQGHATLIRWMSIPIWDNDKIIAVLGLANKETDYDEIDLHEVDILMKNVWNLINLIKVNEDLIMSETLLRASMDSQDTVVIIDTNYRYKFFNENHRMNMKNLYQIDVEIGDYIFENVPVSEDMEKEKRRYEKVFQGKSLTEIDVYGIHQDQYFETKYSPIYIDNKIIGLSIFTTNITLKMQEQKRIEESEEKFRLIYSTMSQGLAIHEVITNQNNEPIDYRYIEVNDSYLKLFGVTKEDVIGKTVKEVAPLIEEYWIQKLASVALTGNPIYYENYSRSVQKHLGVYSYSPKYGQFAVLISDISERIQKEKEIKYLSYNDPLTTLRNRRYYDQKIVELDSPQYYPISMLIGDVNGLKLMNDSFGHQTGDLLLQEVAKVLIESCRNTDIITRIGGDEFVILLPNTNTAQVDQVLKRIRASLSTKRINGIEISVSFGFDTKEDDTMTIEELFKSAEDRMYRNKLIDTKSMRNKTVDLIIATLFEKSNREMLHSKRVSEYSVSLGKALHLKEEDINILRNAGLMHDIGKIGISDAILNKKDRLTEEEFIEIQKHAEIGSRILSSVPDFAEIAKYIAEHHEYYDGSGYPYGLKNEEITLFARIISVCDAFDAMTGPRPYKKPMSVENAIQELKQSSGQQFDPTLVDVFIEKVLRK